jgi:hypothetical protein
MKRKNQMINSVFVNHTNHISSAWSEEQVIAAGVYGKIVDVLVPSIGATMDEQQVACIAQDYVVKILDIHPAAVLCQGEFTYTYDVVNLLRKAGIIVLAACSERCVVETTGQDGNTYRQSAFHFVRFREYK